jgi:Right handed beta helix region
VLVRWGGLLLAVLTTLSTSAPGRIRRVPAQYRTIQEAIDSAAPGDTVLVAPGRYQENIRFHGKGILLASEYLLKRDPGIIHRTIIDGGHPAHADTASVVLFIEQEDTTAVLLGFTITGGKGTVWTDARDKTLYREGGGVLCELSSPVIEHNIIEGNEAIEVGSGLLSAGGGGIRCGYAEPIIRHNVIRGNRGHYGAGVVLFHSAATVRNNLIVGNQGGTGFGGSGIWAVGRLSFRLSNLIEQNTIVGNVASLPDTTPGQMAGKGGGLTLYAPVLIRNNIIWGNRQAIGGQIDSSNRRPPTLRYNLIEDGRVGAGNLDRPPGFADTVTYYLGDNSSAIDAGDPASPHDPVKSRTAIAPSKGKARADLGAYGGAGSAVLLQQPAQ